ncbi:MAG: copper resistance CopC family protein [Gammaproteobacteria bacterium]
MRFWRTRLAIGAILLSGVAMQVNAHAIVVAAEPAANSVVHSPEFTIDLKFNSRIDRSRSRLALIDANGRSCRLELISLAPSDRMQAHASHVVPGRYRLEWVVLSTDGHITRGNLKLEVSQSR